MRSRLQAGTTRLALGGAAAALVWLSTAGAAGAATPPPTGGVLDPVTTPATTAVTQLLAGTLKPSSPGPGMVPGNPAPALPAPVLPAPAPPAPARPGPHPASPSQAKPGTSAEVRAPAGDDRAAVDAAVAEFLGVCARVPQGAVPARATVLVLDRDVIAELVAAGVPLRPLVVPCPAAAVGGPSAPAGPTPSGTAESGSGALADARSAAPTSLAFTGSEIGATLLLGGGLVALGLAFTRKARQLAAVR